MARRLGFVLIWPDEGSIRLVDHVRAADVDAVLMPAPGHLDAFELNAILHFADIETACPRMSFGRWAALGAGA
ncbi:hypothetical protein [Nocardia sp. BMG51109]|uniref:hypothetical protein n=1 Tax=Nocardia sp. BMG51109 TaxID=1056816 RepID=UPI00350F6752